ncbi:hypothetical protein [Geodermatophilus sp. SYSU D00684]
MTEPDAAPVHRCAFHAGRAEAGAIAADLCRRALAAGRPVVAHVDDELRREVVARLPAAAGVAFAPHRGLAERSLGSLLGEWTGRRPPGGDGPVTVLCQQAFPLVPDAGLWHRAEHATTAAVAGHGLAVTCLVDTAEGGPPERLAVARATHPVLWWDGGDVANPDLRPPAGPPGGGGVLVADRLVDPSAGTDNRRWWDACLAAAGLARTRREELVLVLHEAVGTAAVLDGDPAGARGGVRVRVVRHGGTLTAEVAVRSGCPPLEAHAVPADRRLLMLWLAGKVSPAVSLGVRPDGTGSRIVVRALDPDTA